MSAPALDVAAPPVWLPGTYTRPVENPDYSEGDRLIKLAEAVFRFEQSDEMRLDEWQKWLVREVLQKYPAGHELAGELVYKHGAAAAYVDSTGAPVPAGERRGDDD